MEFKHGGATSIKTADRRLAQAFCEGMAHRLSGTALAKPITDNPYIGSTPDAELKTAWDNGWNSAQADAGGALTPHSCALSGTVAA